MSTTAHEDNLEVNITLQSAPLSRAGFGNLLLIAPLANSSLSASESPVKAYSNAEDVAADWTTQEENAAQVYFAQTPQPSTLLIGEWDKAGGETIDTALNNIIDDDDNFYAVAATTRTDTEQETLSAEVESHSKRMLHLLQSSLDDIVTTSADPPLTGTDLEPVIGRERTMILYHPTDSEWYDMAQAGDVLPFDPDDDSSPWYQNLAEVADPRSNLPTGANIGTQQDPANLRDNNSNIALPFYPADAWSAPGTNANGRQMSVMVTRDWLEARLKEDVAQEIVDASNRGEKIPVGQSGETETVGQVRFAKLVRKRLKQGERVGHFLAGETIVRYPQVTSSDVSSGIVPLEVEATVAIGAQAVTIDVNLSRDPI